MSSSVLSNSLATGAQIELSSSQLDNVPADLENSIRYSGASFVQAAGVLLRLPQDVIAQAIVVFTRFWAGPEGGSLKEHGAHDISAASIYLMAKLSAYPKSPRAILNVYAFLSSHNIPANESISSEQADPETYYISEGSYSSKRALLTKHETLLLRTLGFQTHVSLPHTLCINYLQTLEVFSHESGKALANRAFAYLNTVLLSPQLVYLTHQPPALAAAAIYLAARDKAVKLPEEEWWEVFDTEREELGFLVVAMLSMEGFAKEERRKWGRRRVPMTVIDLEEELVRRRMLEDVE